VDWQNIHILDNTLENLLWFSAIILVAFIVKKYLSQLTGLIIHKFVKHFTGESFLQKFQSLIVPPLQYVFFLLIVRFAVELLKYPALWKINILKHSLQDLLGLALATLIWASFTWLFVRIAEFIGFIMKVRAARTETVLDDQWVPFIKDTIKIVVLIFSFLFLLGGIYGFNITSLLAGVGIGGLAIALAAQESLKNLFGSLTIFMDKPFQLGDFVKIGDVQGTVEKIGFRSTRIRTAETSYVTMPNKIMVDSSVDNITYRRFLRVRMNLGLKYGVRSDALRNIITELRLVIESHADKNADNFVVFDSFGETSITLSIQYFIQVKPNKEFLKEKQEINFQIMEIIERHGAEFYYPQQEIRMVTPETSLSK